MSLMAAQPGHAAPPDVPSYRFCYGLDHPSDLPIITELGLDTLYVQVSLQNTLDLRSLRGLIEQAQRSGLKVIVELPTCLNGAYRVSPWDERYAGASAELIGRIVSDLADEPGLTAWATASFLERRLNFSDGDFRAWLQSGYGSLEALNGSWGSNLPAWQTITIDRARELERGAPSNIGRAAIDLADYQASAFGRVMQHWLDAIRRHDPLRPVLTGRISLYRSLPSVPPGYDVVCVSMPPDVLERDLQAHNPQALDMARRGGQFRVLPAFRVPGNASPAYADGSLAGWAQHAALHGAVGFGLEDWELLGPYYDLEIPLAERKQRLLSAIRTAAAVPFGLDVEATSAIIYSPYASGFDVTRQPVYGYLLDYLPGEPSNLAWALRMGTRFGLVDYLATTDFPRYDLSRYGCVLAPACLNLPTSQAAQLDEYVRQGGALVADLGLGAYQTKSWAILPPPLQQALGIIQMGGLKERVGDLVAAEGLPAISPWPRGAKAMGLFSARGGATASAAERRTYPVSGWVAEARISDRTAPLATVAVRFDEDKQPLFSGLLAAEHGSGLAVFATHPLWQYWPLTDALSQLLHNQLMGRRADYELAQAGLLQDGLYFSAGADMVALYNPQRSPVLARVRASVADSHAYSDCASRFVASPGDQGFRPGTALLMADVPGHQARRLSRSSLVVQPYAAEATVRIMSADREQMVVEVAGAGASVVHSARGLEIRGGQSARVRMILSDGAYGVEPGSRHVVTVKTRTRETQSVVAADNSGSLDLSGTYPAGTITIAPAPE